MDYQIFSVGAFQENCVVLVRGKAAWIVDPGAEARRIESYLSGKGLEPELILLTHGHFDHIGAINDLQAAYEGLPVYVQALDAAILTHPLNCFPPDYEGIEEPRDIRDCRELGGVWGVEVLEVPGHTPGGCAYYFAAEKLVLTGDTLFAGSVGRTDFPGGSMEALMKSLDKLAVLPDETVVVPGHGGMTTIGAEKRGNPYFAGR
jgi:hydroxyacylglutathione hydrolase